MRKRIWNILNNYNCLTLLLNCIEFYIVAFSECVNIIVVIIIDFNIIVAFGSFSDKVFNFAISLSPTCLRSFRAKEATLVLFLI